VYPDATRCALIDLAERHGLVLLADEVYGDLAYDGPVKPMGSLAPDASIISFSSLSKAYLAPGWRCGWMVVGRTPRLDDLLAAIKKLADGRLCANGPSQYAIEPALLGDRTHQDSFRRALRTRAELTVGALNAIPGITCVPPAGAFYAMPKVALEPGDTDERYILELLRATGVLCVYGSGFGMPASDGFFRVVFLANPSDLTTIYASIDTFTRSFLPA
jgi:alanine-synthesizing transaminase